VLPAGLSFDPQSGELRGRFSQEGTYPVPLSAQNARGLTRRTVEIQVTGRPWDAQVDPRAGARAGAAVGIGFAAFDAQGMLNYIDVTDLTTGTSLGRIAAGENERRNWQGAFEVALGGAGRHSVLLRFVRFEPGVREPYTFVDRLCRVDVSP
jgi:hypothetical protein